MSNIIYLRPHHALCLRFYRGEGYSDTFNEGMAAIARSLAGGKALVRITSGTDDICKSCPRAIGGICLDEGKSGRYDEITARIASLKPNDTFTWTSLKARLDETVFSGDQFSLIYLDCTWAYMCRSTQKHRTNQINCACRY